MQQTAVAITYDLVDRANVRMVRMDTMDKVLAVGLTTVPLDIVFCFTSLYNIE